MINSIEPTLWTAVTFLGWFLASYCYYGLGITLGYHRLLTHKSLKVPKWLMYVICSGGYFCLMGSPLVWVGVHRLHHQKSDMPGDPHTPTEGFWHALVGWMFHMEEVQNEEELQRAAGEELVNDKLFYFLGHDHKAGQAQLCLAINVAARLVILALFGPVALVANVLALGIVFFATQFVNTFCHMPAHGYRLFETREGSRNVWWVAILSMGEGWHNNHHAIPRSAQHGMAWWEFDATWCTILLLEKLGLATDVVRPAKERMPWFKGPKPAAAVAAAHAGVAAVTRTAAEHAPTVVSASTSTTSVSAQ